MGPDGNLGMRYICFKSRETPSFSSIKDIFRGSKLGRSLWALLLRGDLNMEDENYLLPSIDQYTPLFLPEVSVSMGVSGF